MPELPEVETVVRGLRAPLIGRTILEMQHDSKSVIRPAPEEFADRIQGQTIRAVNRRAKYILCELDHDVLIVHLKMTGRLYVIANDAISEADRWVHFCLQLDNGQQLRFSDSRRFGRVYLTEDVTTVTGQLGPEPLADEFTAEVFHQRLLGRHKSIKPLLLDQERIAGVGNIYADEALHLAMIHPLRHTDTLSSEEILRLHAAIREVLQAGIEREGASVNWYRKPDGTQGEMQNHLAVYDREGQPCTRCGQPIHKIRVGGRGTHFCPQCQPVEANV
jgi:formamidopyrimidine-DNA glycosylase